MRQISKAQLSLNKTVAKKDIDVKAYSNLYVGFELECNDIDLSATANKYGITTTEHTRGIQRKIEKVNLRTDFGARINLDVPIVVNKYTEPNIVVDCYNDGTMESEIVTRPVTLDKLYLVKKVYDELLSDGAEFYADGSGGCHMTFLVDHHQAISEFSPIVAQNLMQIVRAFYPDIIMMFAYGNKTRCTTYRRLPEYSEVMNVRTSHYTAINLKSNNGKIWGIEVRLPDGCNNWEHLQKQAIFWAAAIRQAAIISKYGLIGFGNDTFRDNHTWYTMYLNENIRIPSTYSPNIKLMRLLEPSLNFLGYNNIVPHNDADYEVQAQILEGKLSGMSEREIRKAFGIKRTVLEKSEV